MKSSQSSKRTGDPLSDVLSLLKLAAPVVRDLKLAATGPSPSLIKRA